MCTLSGSTNDEENKNKGKPNHLCELVSPWWWDTGMAAGAWGAGGQAGPPSACLSLCSLAFQASQQDAHSHKLVLQAEQQMLGPSPRHAGQWEPPAAPAVLAPTTTRSPSSIVMVMLGPDCWELGVGPVGPGVLRVFYSPPLHPLQRILLWASFGKRDFPLQRAGGVLCCTICLCHQQPGLRQGGSGLLLQNTCP